MRVLRNSYDELADFLKCRKDEILEIIKRAERFAQMLLEQPPEFILCHADIHGWNLLIDNHGALYIVVWDNPKLAPKEHDLMHFGGSTVWNSSHTGMFYRGYGVVGIDIEALAYYRYERIVQDIAEFCKQLLLTDEGGANRQEALVWFTSQFLPGRVAEDQRGDNRRRLHHSWHHRPVSSLRYGCGMSRNPSCGCGHRWQSV